MSSDEEEEVEASHTDQYPVAIEGLCEAGKTKKKDEKKRDTREIMTRQRESWPNRIWASI